MKLRIILIAILLLSLPLRGVAAITMFPCETSPDVATVVGASHDMAAMMDMPVATPAQTSDTEDNGCMKMHGTACAFGAAVAPGPSRIPEVAPLAHSIFLPDVLPPATFTPEQPHRPPRVFV